MFGHDTGRSIVISPVKQRKQKAVVMSRSDLSSPDSEKQRKSVFLRLKDMPGLSPWCQINAFCSSIHF